MAADLPLPKRILAHAHWTMDKAKMSKSRGNVASPHELLEALGQDGARFYMVRDGGIANDAGKWTGRVMPLTLGHRVISSLIPWDAIHG